MPMQTGGLRHRRNSKHGHVEVSGRERSAGASTFECAQKPHPVFDRSGITRRCEQAEYYRRIGRSFHP
jgi:hypothetical protein